MVHTVTLKDAWATIAKHLIKQNETFKVAEFRFEPDPE